MGDRIARTNRRHVSVRLALGALLAAALLSGCRSAPPRLVWSRPPGHEPLPYRVRLTPLKDLRPGMTENLRGVAWVPLVPFAPTTFHRPGERLGFPDPAQEIPLALANELIEAEVFQSVDASYLQEGSFRPSGPGRLGGADLVLEGRLETGRVHMRFITYGISFGATALWIVGWPMRRITLEIEAVFHLLDATTGERLWTYRMQDDWGQWQGFFYGRNFYHFPALAERAVKRMVLDLDAAIAAGLLREG